VRMVRTATSRDGQKQGPEGSRQLIAAARRKRCPYFTENVRRYVVEKYGSDALYKEALKFIPR